MDENNEIIVAMLDEEFQEILKSDPVIAELEKNKYDPTLEFYELMSAFSKVFTIDGTVVSCITPAIWAYLYAIGSPYVKDGEIHEIDTDIVLYILHSGMRNVDKDLVDKANGFCASHGINPATAENDIKTMIYLSFRPLEMLKGDMVENEPPHFDLDWITHLVSVVCPLTGRTADQIIFDTSLCECMYYCIQKARESDEKGEIRRRNSAEVEGEIYRRSLDLGREYYERKHGASSE